MDFEYVNTSLFRKIWTEIGINDAGESVSPPVSMGVASVQISGDFGDEGGKARLEISNDGVTWIPMLDKSGAFVEAAVDTIFEISSAAVYIRPVSDGAASINVILAVWRA